MQTDNSQLSPEAFKQRIIQKYPNGVASDGTKYSDMNAVDLTKRIVGKYPDGVTSDGHKYSDFLPKETSQTSSDATQPSLISKIGHGAANILSSVESPFVSLGALPVQALAKATGQPDPYAEGIPNLGGSNIPVSKLGVEQKLGDAAQVASYFVPGSGVLGATAMGGLQGAGQAMSQGKNLPEVATQGALGAAIGGGTALATKVTGGLINKAGEALSGEGQNKAVQGIKDAYSEALNLHQGERAFENRSGKDLAQVLLDNRAPLGKYADGTLDASGAVAKLQSALDPLNAQANDILANPQGVVKDISLSDTFQAIKDQIQKLPIPQAQKNAAISHAADTIQAEVTQYGESVSPQIGDQIKQGFWGSVFSKTKFAPPIEKLKGNVDYIAGKALQGQVEDAVAGTDAGDILGELNARRSDLVDAIKRLNNLDGVQKVVGGRLGNIAGGVKGAIIGAASGFGAPGAILGDYFGQEAAQFLNNPATKIGTAELKSKIAGFLPSIVGEGGRAVGQGISKFGQGISKSARFAGLLNNIIR